MLNDVLKKADLHIKRAESAWSEIRQWGDFSADIYNDSEKVKTVDSFIYRFIKLQDLVGQKLFKSYLDDLGDYRDDMSFLDVLDRLEKLKVIESADQWMGYRKLRNELTHEYPDNESEILDGIKIALDAFVKTVEIIEKLKPN